MSMASLCFNPYKNGPFAKFYGFMLRPSAFLAIFLWGFNHRVRLQMLGWLRSHVTCNQLSFQIWHGKSYITIRLPIRPTILPFTPVTCTQLTSVCFQLGVLRKPHVGFPEMAKHEYAKQILAAGFKVVVVEQVERVVETNQRKNEGNSGGSVPVDAGKDPRSHWLYNPGGR